MKTLLILSFLSLNSSFAFEKSTDSKIIEANAQFASRVIESNKNGHECESSLHFAEAIFSNMLILDEEGIISLTEQDKTLFENAAELMYRCIANGTDQSPL